MLTIQSDARWTIFGAFLAITGCIFQAIGFILQKIAHNRIEKYNNEQNKSLSANPKMSDFEDPKSPYENMKQSQTEIKPTKNKKYIQSKLWLFGFFLNGVIGSLFNICALNYAPQSVVLPLSATTLVGNTILATKYLNESFPMQDFIGVCLVIIGSIGTIIVGPKQSHNRQYNSAVQKSKWQNPSFLIFFGAITFIIIVCLALIHTFNRVNQNKKEEFTRKEIYIFEGKDIGQYTIVYCQCFYLISYPLISAYCASINFLVLKSLIQIIDASIKSTESAIDNFTFWLTYVYIISIVILNFLLEMYRQKALRIFGAVYVIPIFQVFVIILGTTMGAIYFNEFKNMSVSKSILFVFCVLITVMGVMALTLSNFTPCSRYLLTATSNDSDCESILRSPTNNSFVIGAPNINGKNLILSTSELEAVQV